MPAFIAFMTGVANEVESISVVAIPAALADTAALICATICADTDAVDPVHFGVGRPSSAAASANPYWVGTKKLLVVTWLTNQNCHAGVFAKLPAALFAPALAPDELHAASRAEAAAVALTRPVPFSSLRRLGPSCMFSVWIASSTFGSTMPIADLLLNFLRRGGPHGAAGTDKRGTNAACGRRPARHRDLPSCRPARCAARNLRTGRTAAAG